MACIVCFIYDFSVKLLFVHLINVLHICIWYQESSMCIQIINISGVRHVYKECLEQTSFDSSSVKTI